LTYKRRAAFAACFPKERWYRFFMIPVGTGMLLYCL
jgi:hypothetical protein